MNAGLPGIGISGIFFILSALAMPLFKLSRKSRFAGFSWLLVLTQFLITILIIAMLVVVNVYAFSLMGSLDAESPRPNNMDNAIDVRLLLPFLLLGGVVTVVLSAGFVLRRAQSQSSQQALAE